MLCDIEGRKAHDEAPVNSGDPAACRLAPGSSSRGLTTFIPRPAPDDPTPAGIAYLCDGRKEVSVVYAKNRASVTLDGRTWRMEYQPTDGRLPLCRHRE